MQKNLRESKRGITFAPATRKNGDAKTPRGVAPKRPGELLRDH